MEKGMLVISKEDFTSAVERALEGVMDSMTKAEEMTGHDPGFTIKLGMITSAMLVIGRLMDELFKEEEE